MKDGFRSVFFCDNVLQDKKNKWSIIGIYSGDIMVSAFPVKLRLAFYSEYVTSNGADLELYFYVGRKRHAKVVGKIQSKDQPPLEGVGVIAIPSVELGVDRPMELRVTGGVAGGKQRTIIRKRIKQGSVGDD